jgi:hypothetical protein
MPVCGRLPSPPRRSVCSTFGFDSGRGTPKAQSHLQVGRRVFKAIFILKTIISPRQARDKHRTKLRQEAFSQTRASMGRTRTCLSTSRRENENVLFALSYTRLKIEHLPRQARDKHEGKLRTERCLCIFLAGLAGGGSAVCRALEERRPAPTQDRCLPAVQDDCCGAENAFLEPLSCINDQFITTGSGQT